MTTREATAPVGAALSRPLRRHAVRPAVKRYAVYTMRRTSTRTVYAIYDNAQRAPWSPPGVGRVFTTTDRSDAVQRARLLNAAVPL